MKKRYVTFMLLGMLTFGTVVPVSVFADETDTVIAEDSSSAGNDKGTESSGTNTEKETPQKEEKSTPENESRTRTATDTSGNKDDSNTGKSGKTDTVKDSTIKHEEKRSDTDTDKETENDHKDDQTRQNTYEDNKGDIPDQTDKEKTWTDENNQTETKSESKNRPNENEASDRSDGTITENGKENTQAESDVSISDSTAGSDGAIKEGQDDADSENEDGDDGTQTLDIKNLLKSIMPESAVKENKTKMTSGEEWKDIPHTAIEYNTWDKYTDSLGAVYSKDGRANFDIYSEMPAHLGEAGGEFTSGITVKLNDSYDTAFYPRFITVDEKGNVNWDPQLTNLKAGKYKLYIASTDAWHTSSNIKDLNDKDQIYGQAEMTIGVKQSDGETRDTMRWNLDLDKVAKRYGMSGDEVKEVSAQYSRLGQQWVTCAGTPTGTKGLFGILAFITGIIPIGISKFRIFLP